MIGRMRRLCLLVLVACGGSDGTPGTTVDAATGADASGADAAPGGSLSFFITSMNKDGGDLGGLAGADAHCQSLAAAVGAGARTWRAYLSVSAGAAAAVNARDRIGTGPWWNARGVMIAASVAELHGTNNLDGTTALDETGAAIPGRGMSPNRHDIMTGSTADGLAYPASPDKTCQAWTSNNTGAARLGHHDRQGGGTDPTSWSSAHDSSGCSPSALVSTGGNGYIYCFAAN